MSLSGRVIATVDLREMAELHMDVLYEVDASGRITAARDSDEVPPLFHLVRTRQGNHWLLGARVPRSQRERLEAALASESVISDCAQAEISPPNRAAIHAALGDGNHSLREHRGPAFVFPDLLPVSPRAELLVDPKQIPLEGRFAWLHTAGEASRPIVVVRAQDGELASVCHAARSTRLAAEAGVETAEGYRRRGYGLTAVAAWATAVRRNGSIPLYSTSWDNAASLALARRLGLICWGEDLHID